MNSSPEQLGSYLWARRVARCAAPERMEPDWITRALEMPAHPGTRRTVRILGKPYHWVAGGGTLKLRAGESPW